MKKCLEGDESDPVIIYDTLIRVINSLFTLKNTIFLSSASLHSQESDLQRRNRLKLRRLFLLNHHGSR